MESSDYAQKFNEVKNEILKEIRETIGYNSEHRFKEPFYIHYVEGEVATTETCVAIRVDNNGMVVIDFYTTNECVVNSTDGESVFMYEPNSFLDILDHLKKDLREKKLAHIRDIVKKHNGRIEFDNKFRFTGFDGDSECEFVGLLSLSLKEDGKLNIEDEWQDGIYDNSENFIPDSELDRFIEYVESKTAKKFKVRAYETFSRTFEIEAIDFDAACEKVREELERFPFEEGDSDGLCFA